MASWLSGSVASASRQMLSASPGSFSRRYRSALASARGTASGERVLRSNMATSTQHSKYLRDRVVQLIDDALFEGNDGVVGDGDAFWTDLRAAFRNVAEADAVCGLQIVCAPFDVERIHLERGGVDHVARSDELVEHMMVAQYVADVLTQKALDALAEFLNALRVHLL